MTKFLIAAESGQDDVTFYSIHVCSCHREGRGWPPGWGDRHFTSSLGSLGLRIADALEMSPQTCQQAGGASTFPGPLPNPHQNLTCWESLHNKDGVAFNHHW